VRREEKIALLRDGECGGTARNVPWNAIIGWGFEIRSPRIGPGRKRTSRHRWGGICSRSLRHRSAASGQSKHHKRARNYSDGPCHDALPFFIERDIAPSSAIKVYG